MPSAAIGSRARQVVGQAGVHSTRNVAGSILPSADLRIAQVITAIDDSPG